MTREIGRAAARRYLVLRHLLAPARSLPAGPAAVMRVFERLGTLQFDPIDVAGRNHDLSLLARVEGYRREWTDDLLYRDRLLYETYNKGFSLVPTADLPWYRLSWDRNRERMAETTFTEHADLVEELLDRVRREGPLAVGDMPARAAIDWFWRPTNQVRALLEALAISGVLGLARRDGNRRVYDLVERLFPAELLAERREEPAQWLYRLFSRVRAHGLLSTGGNQEVWLGTGPNSRRYRAERLAELVEDGRAVMLQVDGLKDPRFAPAADLDLLEQAEREVAAGAPPGGTAPTAAFLAPLDPLVWDRALLRDLFDFDYLWEVYVTPAKRRWGYYVLPVLYGDRFAGRIELRADRREDVLRVLGWWWEPGFDPRADPDLKAAVAEALEAHRAFTGVRRVAPPGARLRASRPATRKEPARTP